MRKFEDRTSALVVIPAYNESGAIADIVTRCLATRSKDGTTGHAVLVVSDASTDDTALRARAAGACVL